MKFKYLKQPAEWKKIQTKLILENCLTFGHDQKLTKKKIARYLLGTRINIELFKLYELRCLLLKIYPLIHTLFYNPRSNFELETKKLQQIKFLPTSSIKKKFSQPKSNVKTQRLIQRSSLISKHKNLTPQILFASVTPAFGNIVQGAAELCNMPVHKNRWLNGSITAAISHFSDQKIWNYLYDSTQKNIIKTVTKTWGTNKEHNDRIKEKITYYGSSRWPSLLIIPDIANNAMIIKEAKAVNLPIIGLVNSHCQLEIDYPIFAQDQTSQSIYFFCYFLAGLIAKEMVYIRHKRFTIQKTKQQTLKTVLKRSRKQPTENKLKLKTNNKKLKLKTNNKKLKLKTNNKKLKLKTNNKKLKLKTNNKKLKLKTNNKKLKLKTNNKKLKLKTNNKKLKLKTNNKTFFFKHIRPFQEKNYTIPLFWRNLPSVFVKMKRYSGKRGRTVRQNVFSSNLPWPRTSLSEKEKRAWSDFQNKLKKKYGNKAKPWHSWKAKNDVFTNKKAKKRKIKRHFKSYIKCFFRVVKRTLQQAKRYLPKIIEKKKYLVFWQHWTRSKRAVVIMNKENRKKFASFQKKNAWTWDEKKEAWQQIINFFRIENFTNLQRTQYNPALRWHLNKTNNNYYWVTVQNWNQDPKWQNHKFIINNYIESLYTRSRFNEKQYCYMLENKMKKKTYYKKKSKHNWKKKPWHSWKAKNDVFTNKKIKNK